MNFRATILLVITASTNAMDDPTQKKRPNTSPEEHPAKKYIPLNELEAAGFFSKRPLDVELYDLMNTTYTEISRYENPRHITNADIEKIINLVMQNADVNHYKDSPKDSALVLAVKIGNLTIFESILNKCTNLHIAQEALLTALILDRLPMAELLVRKFGIQKLDKFPKTQGDNYLIHKFLDNIAAKTRTITPTNPEIKSIRSAAHTAGKKESELYFNDEFLKAKAQEVERLSVQGVEFLLKHKLDSLLNEKRRSKDGYTPLMVASDNGLLGVVQLLTKPLARNSDIQNIRTSESQSYLRILPKDVLNTALIHNKPLGDIHKESTDGSTAYSIAILRVSQFDAYKTPHKDLFQLRMLKDTAKYLKSLKDLDVKDDAMSM